VDSDPTGESAGHQSQGPDAIAGVRAADVFTADLRPRPDGRLRHRARIAAPFVTELFCQLIPSPSVHDVVVTRRQDGTEILRVPTGEPFQAGDLLAQIRREPARLDAESFPEWSELAPRDR
jgi:hypothetical protein